jgi:hypothetical protein
MKMNSAAKGPLLCVLLFAGAFVTGCATAPPVDWNSRVGHYTYAQAVNELGPPNREVRLSNGATEFKWFTPPAGPTGFNSGLPNNGVNNNSVNSMNLSYGQGPNLSPGFSSRCLQLTFDTNGVLTAWSKNY